MRELGFVLSPPVGGKQWGEELGYDGPTALAFDSLNRPYLINLAKPETSGYISTLRSGKWVKIHIDELLFDLRRDYRAIEMPVSGRHAFGRMVFDDSDGLYLLLYVDKKPVLVFSPDFGKSCQVFDLNGTYAFLEPRGGHNDLSSSPALGLLEFQKEHPAPWVRYYTLSITAPVRKGDRLEIPKPVAVVDDCFGIGDHAGGEPFAVTVGNQTHFVYVRIPEDRAQLQEGRNNPTYLSTYDRTEHRIVATRHITDAYPDAINLHSTPVMTVDSRGCLHVITGAHGGPFLYLRSLEPNTIQGTWTEEEQMGTRQTYATLLCDKDDVLHSIFREWRTVDGTTKAVLSYQRKLTASRDWEEAVPLVFPPYEMDNYGIHYHRAFVDRLGSVYVAFTYYTPVYDNDSYRRSKGAFGRHPQILLMTEDGGENWKLATTEVFRRRVFGG
jgi:hypothetical protein